MSYIFLGNLSPAQIGRRLKVNFSDDDCNELESFRICKTDEVKGNFGWHCYDAPFGVECGTWDAITKFCSIVGKYPLDFSGLSFSIYMANRNFTPEELTAMRTMLTAGQKDTLCILK